ncbi:hypothetical protein [Phenylobacterium sp.]|uniref:hypothetical protein n=1 Tax=Phenylobacterium sp. TaxID=1871053 RepID=UPI002721404B|nr:hypothetical protein [Phenylobacterium sp.]MDO8378064.1 hypothetical protein [Phenylobacterium sp.]
MKAIARTLLFALACLAAPAHAQAPPTDRLAPVAALVGDWTGVGEGQPGTSASTRHATRIQAGHFIMVEGRSVYPPQDRNKTGEVHTSLDVWSYDTARKRLMLRQFDSLGFVSTYAQDLDRSRDRWVVMVSEHLENVPAGWRARYTYEFAGPNAYREHFELDAGKGLETYVSGKYLRDRAATDR